MTVNKTPRKKTVSPPKRSREQLSLKTQLSSGDRGHQVLKTQEILTAQGYYQGRVDGRYGILLSKAVRRFQADHDLRVTGDVNPVTWEALLKSEEKV